jgi:hypothetical protein
MKYVMHWKKRRHGTLAEYEAGQAQVMALMRNWRKPEGVIIHEFLVRVAEPGGYAVFETEDLTAVHAATRAFSSFNFHIEPVIDIDVALANAGLEIEWRDSVV